MGKMQWVPPDVEVTPEIACKGIDALKKEYPDHAVSVQQSVDAKVSEEAAEKRGREKLAHAAKDMSVQLGDEFKAIISEATLTKEAQKRLVLRLQETLKADKDLIQAIGDDALPRAEKVVTAMVEQLTLG